MPASKVVLVETGHSDEPAGPRVRRYRFARIALGPAPYRRPADHEHLKRVYD